MEDNSKKIPCRYCKLEINRGERRCPYCGTFNPSMGVKQSLIWTVFAILFLYLLAFILETFR